MARLAAGLPVATLLPKALPHIGHSAGKAFLLAAACAGIVAAPLLPAAAAWIALVGAPVLAFGMTLPAPPLPHSEPNTPMLREATRVLWPALLLAAASLAALDWDGLVDALRAAVDSNALVVVASGAAAAVFLGGPVVGWVLRPFAKVLETERKREAEEAGRPDQNSGEVRSLENAGTMIGWFERALFFALLVGGSPQAAAVALAAKSVARFPLLSEKREGFAEYFLIGTLASLTIAVAAAVAVRAATGSSAF